MQAKLSVRIVNSLITHFSISSLFFCLIAFIAEAQTPNDNIENRIQIFPDSTIHSITNGNTVQWNCVDEKLTGKCIKYHNDQWFYFNAIDSSVQYLNVTGQDCRDLWGVQLVVIEGIPCQTETYQVITCVSFGTQDDVFVPLHNLKPGAEYLLDIDGYLHDYCSFNMVLSKTPKGLPVVQDLQVEGRHGVAVDTLHYQWKTPDSLRDVITRYSIYRRKGHEVRFSIVQSLLTKADAYGETRTEFEFEDIITDNDAPWSYKLVGETSGVPIAMDQFDAYPDWRAQLKNKNRIWVELTFSEPGPVHLQLIDHLTGAILDDVSFDYSPDKNNKTPVDLGPWIKSGVKTFDISARNMDTQEIERMQYEYADYKIRKVR